MKLKSWDSMAYSLNYITISWQYAFKVHENKYLNDIQEKNSKWLEILRHVLQIAIENTAQPKCQNH